MQPQQTLVQMANQIGDFFRYQADEPAAMESVAGHLHHFWAPSMRRDLVRWLDEHAGEGMTPLTRASVQAYRGVLLGEIGAPVPGEQRLEQPRGGGDAG